MFSKIEVDRRSSTLLRGAEPKRHRKPEKSKLGSDNLGDEGGGSGGLAVGLGKKIETRVIQLRRTNTEQGSD